MSKECPPKITQVTQETLDGVCANLLQAYQGTTKGTWGKGETSHETVSRNENQVDYHIAKFRHADDATFIDLAHAHMPVLLQAFADMKARIAQLEGNAK